jgi:hypothetical protein
MRTESWWLTMTPTKSWSSKSLTDSGALQILVEMRN